MVKDHVANWKEPVMRLLAPAGQTEALKPNLTERGQAYARGFIAGLESYFSISGSQMAEGSPKRKIDTNCAESMTAKMARSHPYSSELALNQDSPKEMAGPPPPSPEEHIVTTESQEEEEEMVVFTLPQQPNLAQTAVNRQHGAVDMELEEEIDVVNGGKSPVMSLTLTPYDYINWETIQAAANEDAEEPIPKLMAIESDSCFEEFLIGKFMASAEQSKELEEQLLVLQKTRTERDDAMVKLAGMQFALQDSERKIARLHTEKVEAEARLREISQKNSLEIEHEIAMRVRHCLQVVQQQAVAQHQAQLMFASASGLVPETMGAPKPKRGRPSHRADRAAPECDSSPNESISPPSNQQPLFDVSQFLGHKAPFFPMANKQIDPRMAAHPYMFSQGRRHSQSFQMFQFAHQPHPMPFGLEPPQLPAQSWFHQPPAMNMELTPQAAQPLSQENIVTPPAFAETQ